MAVKKAVLLVSEMVAKLAESSVLEMAVDLVVMLVESSAGSLAA